MDKEVILSKLQTKWVAQTGLEIYESVESTMLNPVLEHGHVVIAETQTAGKGRLDHTWMSPKGNIYLSITTKCDEPHFKYLIQLTSLALYDTLYKYVDPTLKWPNDILVNDKKISGICIEKIGDYAVIGIGINVNVNPNINNSTSLKEETYFDYKLDFIIPELLNQFEKHFQSDLTQEFQDWKELISTVGRNVVIDSNGKYAGVVKEINNDGYLVLLLPNGEEKLFCAGDISVI